MTRVLVIGNSHAATLRRAFPEVQAAHPGLSLTFWGLPGAAFDKASSGPDGRLRPDPTDRTSRRKVDQWNDAAEADLTTPDHIFLVGLRFGLREALRLARQLQPLDLGRRAGSIGVSDSFLRAALHATIATSLAAVAARIALDPRFVLMPAPYPATLALDPQSGCFEPITAATADLAHAPTLMALFEAELAQVCAARGLRLVLQPRSTLAGPLQTANRHLDDATRDARHMDTRFGRLACDALLAAVGQTSAASPLHHGEQNHALGS
ncbi:MAG: hypothetical protein U5N53_16585 [Mycobacterium sp.]|nr:hypothetical protein [Mycobacterium sp.]